MNSLSLTAAVVIGVALLASGVVASAQQGAPSAASAWASTYEGTVTAVSGNGFTLTSRYASKTISVTTTGQTRYIVLSRQPVSSLKTGEAVLIGGRVDASTSTVAARLILLANSNQSAAAARRGGGRRGIAGTIESTSPTIMVAGRDGKTYTVAITKRTAVLSHEPGTASDVSVGKLVQVRYEGQAGAGTSGTEVTAREVSVFGPSSVN